MPLDLCILINLIFIVSDVVRSKESLCKFRFPLNQSKLPFNSAVLGRAERRAFVPALLLPSATPWSSPRSLHHQGLRKARTRESKHPSKFWGGLVAFGCVTGESHSSPVSERRVQQKSFSTRRYLQ